MTRFTSFGGVAAGLALVIALAGCGSSNSTTSSGTTAPAVTTATTAPAATTTAPATTAPAITAPAGTTTPAASATTAAGSTTPTAAPAANAPLPTVPVTDELPGVPAAPLPNTAANAVTNAQYACKWYGVLAGLLSGGSRPGLPAQAEVDIRQVSLFAGSAGANESSYAKLAKDAAILSSPAVTGQLNVPSRAMGLPQMRAVGMDCDG